MITGASQMIYFPTTYEHKQTPRILYVVAEFEDEYKGSPLPEELEGGRFGFFKKARCQPFSEEVMEKINKLISERDAINLALEAIRTKKVKK